MPLKVVPLDSNNEKQHRTVIATATNELIKVRPPHDRTEEERAAGVTPTDTRFAPGVLERYGLIGDGSTDDALAFTRAALVGAQGVKLYGTPGKTYRSNSAVPVGDIFDLDLRGATVKPSGNVQLFTHNSTGLSATASTTVSSGATKGSRSVVVSSATGLVVGQWVTFESNHASYQAGSWPGNWAKITSIASTTVEIDTPLGCEYEATVTMRAYDPTLFGERFRLVGGDIDLSASTNAGGNAVDIAGYLNVEIGVALKNAVDDDTAYVAVQLVTCVDVVLYGKSIGNNVAGAMYDIQSIRSVRIPEMMVDTAGFALNIYRATSVNIGQVSFYGYRLYEVDESITATRSVRGLKFIGCLDVNIDSLSINGYTSGIKLESNRQGNIGNVTLRNCAPEAGEIALNVSSQSATLSKQLGWNISNVVIENCLGIAMGFSNPDGGRFQVSNLYIRDTNSHAIFTESGCDLRVVNATIENWAKTVATGRGIVLAGGGQYDCITFRNTDNTRTCFSTPASGKRYSFGLIDNPDGNPLFPSSQLFENFGTATINNGSTSVTVNHSLVKTPAITDFALVPGENPTNDPGNIWISGISSTQFTINCRADPGASNYDIAWRVKLPMPFVMP